MTRRMWVFAVLAWVGVVIAGSALTWLAINRAGDQVSDAADTEATQPVVVSTVNPPPTARPTRPRATKPTPRPTPPATRSGSPSAAPTAAPTPAPPPVPRSPRATVRAETRTWTGSAGFVTVSCTGALAHLQAASPNNGWSVERGDESGDHVEVKFARDNNEIQVRAVCQGGVPQFGVETGGDPTGDG